MFENKHNVVLVDIHGTICETKEASVDYINTERRLRGLTAVTREVVYPESKENRIPEIESLRRMFFRNPEKLLGCELIVGTEDGFKSILKAGYEPRIVSIVDDDLQDVTRKWLYKNRIYNYVSDDHVYFGNLDQGIQFKVNTAKKIGLENVATIFEDSLDIALAFSNIGVPSYLVGQVDNKAISSKIGNVDLVNLHPKFHSAVLSFLGKS